MIFKKKNGSDDEEVKESSVNEASDNEETANSNLDAIQQELKDASEDVQKEEDLNELENLKKELLNMEEEKHDYYNRLQRLQADFTNFKKRVEKEKSEIYQYANEKLVEDLLPIIDNLERALTTTSEEARESNLYKGIQLVHKQLMDTFAKHGIEEIDAINKPFDMNQHHAVIQEEAEAEAETVIEVFQRGYKINNKVIRPAMVKVAK